MNIIPQSFSYFFPWPFHHITFAHFPYIYFFCYFVLIISSIRFLLPLGISATGQQQSNSDCTVANQTKSDIVHCIDSLTFLVVRRLSRHLSASIVSDLREQILEEQLDSVEGYNGENSFHSQSGELSRTKSTPGSVNESRLAKSMNDVSSCSVLRDANCEMSQQASGPSAANSHVEALQDIISLSAASPPKDIDLVVEKLCRIDGCVELLLEQLRLADRYLKDIAMYIEKRTIFCKCFFFRNL